MRLPRNYFGNTCQGVLATRKSPSTPYCNFNVPQWTTTKDTRLNNGARETHQARCVDYLKLPRTHAIPQNAVANRVKPIKNLNVEYSLVSRDSRSKLVQVHEDLDCRMCESKDLITYLDLGELPIADAFTRQPTRGIESYYFPLKLNLCQYCGWSQLSHVVSPEILYQRDYPYDSTITKTGESHWSEFAGEVVQEYGLNHNDLVLDIGSNTGALLKQFNSLGIATLGVDPSSVAAKIANSNGIRTINAFFDNNSANEVLGSVGRPKVITATNSFAHIDDLHAWTTNVMTILDENGVIVIESPHILELIRSTQFDTIYHEHLSYVSITPLIQFFKKYDLQVVKVEKRSIHGGSVRIHVARQSTRVVSDSVNDVVAEEKLFGFTDLQRLEEFATSVVAVKVELSQLIKDIRDKGKTIGIASAPAKGMTLINYVGVRDEDIVCLSDKSDLKIGRYAPGTNLLVKSDEELIEMRPDFIMILAWNFATEIMENLNKVSLLKPQYIIPIPEPMIL